MTFSATKDDIGGVSKNSPANIYAESYNAKALFQADFFNFLQKFFTDKSSEHKVNLFIPQQNVLHVLNSYITFEELQKKIQLNNIFTNVDFLKENAQDKEFEVYNILLLDYSDIPESLSYNLVESLKERWQHVSGILVFGASSDLDDENNLGFMKKEVIRSVYMIPFDLNIDIHFLSLPMWRLGESFFSAKFKETGDYLRPISVNSSILLKNLKVWMASNGVRGINKIIACEKSQIAGTQEGSAIKLANMIENDFRFSNGENSLLFDIKKDCNVFIFDRSCDELTPLLTQLTYAGLLYDHDFGFINDIVSKENNDGNSINDNIFENLKFLNFGEVGSVLQRLLSSYGKATNTSESSKISGGTNPTNISEELNRMIKILADKEVISNSKNLPKHVNKASELMARIKTVNYNMDNIIEIESLLLSEWNRQSQYLNNNSKLKFNWTKLSSNGSTGNRIIDDSFISEWLEEQNFLGNYTFMALLKILVLYNLLYGPFNNKNGFYNRIMNSFSDRFGCEVVVPMFENLFSEHKIILSVSSRIGEKSSLRANSQLKVMENNKKMLKLLDYLNYVPNTLTESMLSMAINETITKTANAVGFALFSSAPGFEKSKNVDEAADLVSDPLSFAYCGIAPIITRFLQYSLTLNSTNPSLLNLGIPPDIIENTTKSTTDTSASNSLFEMKTSLSYMNQGTANPSALLKVKECQLLKSKLGQIQNREEMVFSKNVVIITGGITLSEMATIDKLNKMMLSAHNKNIGKEDPSSKSQSSFIPITVIADKII